MLGKLSDFTVNRDGSQNITVTVDTDFSETYDELKDKDVEIEIKKASRHRSLDANSYLWRLCSEIGKKIYPPISKEEVYRDAITHVGVFQPLLIKTDAVEFFAKKWSEGGTGWFIEVVDNSGDELGYELPEDTKLVHAYYGSSTYSSKEMTTLIGYVVQRAEEQGIPTMSDKERNKTLELWGIKKKEVVT